MELKGSFNYEIKLTNVVVYANESAHNPKHASFMTRVGYMQENRNSLAAYVRTRTRTNVLPQVLPPAAERTAHFRECLQPAIWDTCTMQCTDTNTHW